MEITAQKASQPMMIRLSIKPPLFLTFLIIFYDRMVILVTRELKVGLLNFRST